MQIIDAHIHSDPGEADSRRLMEQLNAAGICGGGIMSPEPECARRGIGFSYEARMKTLEDWIRGNEDRFYPILWISAKEPEAVAKARDAVSRGVMAFKIICDEYFVSDDDCMELVTEISNMGKPIMFHAGILWDELDSGKYNRPLNWECLIRVPGLRFSLAHCGWPWCDETIALYGKFNNPFALARGAATEMFLDLTPGTPVIWRRDLMHKLMYSGYDTSHNILFGTDCYVNHYSTKWAKEWVGRDSRLLRHFGADKQLVGQYFSENFKRFLGLSDTKYTPAVPDQDDAHAWAPVARNSWKFKRFCR